MTIAAENGKKRPDFTRPTDGGGTVKLSSLRGPMRSMPEPNRKPRPNRSYQVQRRNRLMGQDPFESRWPGERVCKKCKTTVG